MMFSSITAGVDTEAPTLEFTGASAGAGTTDGPDRAALLQSEFELQVKDNDDGSGMHDAEPRACDACDPRCRWGGMP